MSNPFDTILKFEQALAEYTGAPYAITTDCCTHAIELCLRYHKSNYVSFTAYTYLSLPMTMHKLGIQYNLKDEPDWVGKYCIIASTSAPPGTPPRTMSARRGAGQFEMMATFGIVPQVTRRIYDCARLLAPNMYEYDTMQCLSFGYDKPLSIGRGGAILLDSKEAYETIIRQRYDGRDLTISPWENQKVFDVGYHYRMTPEEALIGLLKLNSVDPVPVKKSYPDLRNIIIRST